MSTSKQRVVVAGAGGFIGGHLVADLVSDGHDAVAVDLKPFSEWHQRIDGAESKQLDLSLRDACYEALEGATPSTTSPPTWAAWGSSRTTRRCACSPS